MLVNGCNQSCKMWRTLGNGYGWMSAYLGITTSALLPAGGRMPVNRGRVNLEKEFTPFFAVGDTVLVKLAATDSAANTTIGVSLKIWPTCRAAPSFP